MRGKPRRGLTLARNPPTRITPVAKRDKALKSHLESTHFYDEKTKDLVNGRQRPPADPDRDDD